MVQRPSCFVPTSVCFFFFNMPLPWTFFFPFFHYYPFQAKSDQATHTTAWLYIFFLGYFSYFTVWKIRFTFQSPIGGEGRGNFYFPHFFQGHLCANLYYSHSPLWAYIHLLRNPCIIKGEFPSLPCPLMHLIILNHLWNNPTHMLRKRIYTSLLHDVEVTWRVPPAHVTYLHLLILHVLCLEYSICIL